MSLFDQQPMGPVPARRPILMPPDPELEAATDDPATADIELVGPVPTELQSADPIPPHPSRKLRSLRILIVVTLLWESVVGFVIALATTLIPNGSPEYLPRVISFCIVAAVVVLAAVIWRHRSRR